MQATMTCSEQSRAAQDALAGTVKPTDTFFLIQTNMSEFGGWQHGIVKKAGDSGVFAPIIQHLMRAPRAKILFIRRPASEGKNFFIAQTNQKQPRIYHAALSDYERLLCLDMNSLGGDLPPRFNQDGKNDDMTELDALYIVCTNGRHDPCCAARGTPFYQALSRYAGAEKVWQTTHIGGHHLSATMIAFPQGIVYGHLDPEDAEAIVTNHSAGYLLTHKYRGRGAYGGHWLDDDTHQAAGAAEGQIREQTRLYADADLRLSHVVATGENCWRVQFLDSGGKEYEAKVNMSMSGPRLTACGSPPKPMPQHEVSLLS